MKNDKRMKSPFWVGNLIYINGALENKKEKCKPILLQAAPIAQKFSFSTSSVSKSSCAGARSRSSLDAGAVGTAVYYILHHHMVIFWAVIIMYENRDVNGGERESCNGS